MSVLAKHGLVANTRTCGLGCRLLALACPEHLATAAASSAELTTSAVASRWLGCISHASDDSCRQRQDTHHAASPDAAP